MGELRNNAKLLHPDSSTIDATRRARSSAKESAKTVTVGHRSPGGGGPRQVRFPVARLKCRSLPLAARQASDGAAGSGNTGNLVVSRIYKTRDLPTTCPQRDLSLSPVSTSSCKRRICRAFVEADARTRTGDPFITREVAIA